MPSRDTREVRRPARFHEARVPMTQNLHPMLNIAVKAARAAGALINRASLDIEKLQVQVKSANDFVTEVDQAAEQAIIETILQCAPYVGFPKTNHALKAAKDVFDRWESKKEDWKPL